MSVLRLAKIAATSVFQSFRSRPVFSQEEIKNAVLGSRLPQGFLLGAGSAAHQVEGGNVNDWTDWEQGQHEDGSPHVHGAPCGLACDSWNRFPEDLALLRELGANAYRFSLEWSRLEPEEGTWNEEAAERYRSWLRQLSQAGIQTMLTLYHFTLPRWVAARGGWGSDDILEPFDRFIRRAVQAFASEDVRLWCTINEPTVVAVQGYLKGVWPPGLKDPVKTAQVLLRVMKAHARATAAIRERSRAPVGVAHHVRVFDPATRSPLDAAIAGLTDDFANESVLDGHRHGRMQISVPGKIDIDEHVPDLKGSFDYLGLNYYSRLHVRTDFKDPGMARHIVPEGLPVTDMRWEIYPEGLYRLLKRYTSLGLPIYITENGMADQSGLRRPDFLRGHLYAMERAVAEGANVRGYFHWALIDNFEWAEGFTQPFGLYRVDFNHPSRPRSATPAVQVFQEVARRLPK